MRKLLSAALSTLLLAVAVPARASPEWNVGAAAGVAGRGGNGALWSSTAFFGAVRGDVLWGRERWGDIGIGPAAEFGTVGFDDARLHLGVTALLPVGSLLSISVTPAGYDRLGENQSFGASGRVFLGLRSFNYYGSYALSNGLLIGLDQDLSGTRSRALLLAAQVDGALLAIPFILLFEWIRGAPSS